MRSRQINIPLVSLQLKHLTLESFAGPSSLGEVRLDVSPSFTHRN